MIHLHRLLPLAVSRFRNVDVFRAHGRSVIEGFGSVYVMVAPVLGLRLASHPSVSASSPSSLPGPHATSLVLFDHFFSPVVLYTPSANIVLARKLGTFKNSNIFLMYNLLETFINIVTSFPVSGKVQVPENGRKYLHEKYEKKKF